MSDINQIPTAELVHDYLESYMDIARLELTMRLEPEPSMKVEKRLRGNRRIVRVIVNELARRGDTTLYDRRELVLGEFST